MKTFRLIGMALIAILVSVNFAACSSDNESDEAETKTVTIKVAGTLKQILGEQYNNIGALKIIGPLNGDDIRIIRNMSCDSKLSYLDLSGASIVEGGSYYYYTDKEGYHTSNDIIGGRMFDKCKILKTIILPNNITSIGGDAFFDCHNLTSVTIPNSVTSIGIYAFCGCHSLTSVIIPNSVTSIENGVFAESGLTSITIPNSVTSIGGDAFGDCHNLASVTIPNSVTSIGDSAFSGTGLTSVTIPNSVTSIGAYAFYGCKIKDCHIYATTPPTGGFREGTVYAESTLYVPKGCVKAYEKANWGTYFYNIVEMKE